MRARIAAIVCMAVACSPSPDGNVADEDGGPTQSGNCSSLAGMVVEPAEVMPHRVVVVQSTEPLSSADLSVQIGSQPVTGLVQIDSHAVALLVPDVASGQATLQVTSCAATQQATLTVLDAPAIIDPEATLTTAHDRLYLKVLESELAGELPAGATQQLSEILDEAAQAVASASEEDRLLQARFLEANAAAFEEVTFQEFCPDTCHERARCMESRVRRQLTALLVTVGVGLASEILVPGYGTAIKLLSLVAVGYQLYRLNSETLVDFSACVQAVAGEFLAYASPVPAVFNSGETVTIQPELEYVSMGGAVGDGNSVIAAINELVTRLGALWARVNSMYQLVGRSLEGDVVGTDRTAHRTTAYVPPALLSFRLASGAPADLAFEATAGATSVDLVFHNDGSQPADAFLEIAYSNPGVIEFTLPVPVRVMPGADADAGIPDAAVPDAAVPDAAVPDAATGPDCDTDLDGTPDRTCGPTQQCLRTGIEGASGAVAMRQACFPLDSFECTGTASNGSTTSTWVKVCTAEQQCLTTSTNLHTSAPGSTPNCAEPGASVCNDDPNSSGSIVCGASQICACSDPSVNTKGEACFPEARRNCTYELSPGDVRCWSCPESSTQACTWPPSC